MNIKYEEFHRWTVSEELRRPELAEWLAVVRIKAFELAQPDVFRAANYLHGARNMWCQSALNAAAQNPHIGSLQARGFLDSLFMLN